MLRSPWLGVLALVIAGVIGYALSNDRAGGTLVLDELTVTIRPTRPTGGPWDFGGGLPDPRVTILQGETVLARCEAVKDQLKPTCAPHVTIDRGRGVVRLVVVDADTSDDDLIGDVVLDLGDGATTGGAIAAVDVMTTGGTPGAWVRFRPLWIALAIGAAVAGGLSIVRRRA